MKVLARALKSIAASKASALAASDALKMFKIRIATRNQRTSTIASHLYNFKSLNAQCKTLILNG